MGQLPTEGRPSKSIRLRRIVSSFLRAWGIAGLLIAAFFMARGHPLPTTHLLLCIGVPVAALAGGIWAWRCPECKKILPWSAGNVEACSRCGALLSK